MKIFNKKSEEEKVEEEIISMVNEGNEQGLIEDSEAQFITNIFEFTDKESRDVMTARLNVMAIDKNSDLDEVMEIMIENNYSRYLLVYRETIDQVVGVLRQKDFYINGKMTDQPIAEIITLPLFVYQHTKIRDILKMLQHQKSHIAVVVDDFGGTLGIVTVEDILEEIVGNILDEYDDASEDIKKRGDMYIVSGKAELDELSDVLGIEFPDEDFQTLNGFLLYELGRLPYADEEIEIVYQNYRFTSLSVNNNMIDEVKITKVEKTPQ